MARKKLTPFIATTPGEVLKDELIERGLTVTELSSFMGIAPSYIDDIINAKNSIDAFHCTFFGESIRDSCYFLAKPTITIRFRQPRYQTKAVTGRTELSSL